MTWISVKTGKRYPRKKKVESVCGFCGIKYMKQEYLKKGRPNIFCSRLCGIKNYYLSKPLKIDTRTQEEKRVKWRLQKMKERMKTNKETTKIVKVKVQKAILPKDPTEHEMWGLYWDYELPRMERKNLNQKNGRTNRLPSLPKDSFELATYKICELKLNTERFSSYYSKEYVTEFINLPLEERAKNGQH